MTCSIQEAGHGAGYVASGGQTGQLDVQTRDEVGQPQHALMDMTGNL